MSTTCTVNMSQYAKSCVENNLRAFKYKFLVKRGTTVAASLALAATKATYNTLIQSETLIPLPEILEIAPDNKEAAYQEFGLGKKFKVMDAVRRETDSILVPFCSHKLIRTINSVKWDMILMDENYNLFLREVATDDYQGFPVDVEVNLMNWGSGADAYHTPIYLSFDNSSLFDDNGRQITTTWSGADIVEAALKQVDVTVVGTPNASLLVLKVVEKCGATIDGETEYPVTGLVAADFSILAAAGTAQTTTGLTDNGDGTYNLAYDADLVTGTANLATPSDMTTSGYIGGDDATVTVAA